MIRVSYRRPVAVAMIYMAIGLLGVRAWFGIPTELYPDASLPRLTISTTWSGASPETVEAFLTSPVEAAVQLVAGVERVTSRSIENSAGIEVWFARDTDMDFARLDLAERIATLEETTLPPGVQVQVQQYVPRDFQRSAGLLEYTFTGAHTLEALRAHLDEVVVPELSRVDGVSTVEARGGRQRMIELEVDRAAMAALGVSAWEVGNKLRALDLVREAGSVQEGDQEWTITIRNRPTSARDIGDAIIRADGGRIVRIKDVATVRDTWEDIRSHYRINTRPAVRLLIHKEIGANSVRVAERAKERMAQVAGLNPPNTRFILDRDASERIREEMENVSRRVLYQLLAIFVVLLVFMRSIRPALVMFATIAFSVLIALNVIYFAGYTLNLLTLIGLAMGFGLVLDNSIVVLENIHRRWQQGGSREEATQRGASHVVLPIMAATGTNLIVLVPFVYLQDELRVFYLPFGIVVGLSLVASVLVAFSFIPALAGKILPHRAGNGEGTAARRAPIYERFYRGMVTGTLRWPWLTLSVPLIAFGVSGYVFEKYVNRGYVFGGIGNADTYINIRIGLPDGTDIERTDEFTRFFEDRLQEMPEVAQFVTDVGRQSSSIRVTFPREIEHTSIPVSIKDQLFAYSLLYSGVEVRVTGFGPSFYAGGGGGGPARYSIQVLGYNYLEVRNIAEDVGRRLTNISRVGDVNTNSSMDYRDRERAKEFGVHIRRDVLANYDLTVDRLVQEVLAAVRGQGTRSFIKMGGDEVRYDIKVEGSREIDLIELRERLVVTNTGGSVRLGSLVEILPREVLAAIHREDQQYERAVGYEFRGPGKLGERTQNTAIDETDVPPGYVVEKRGWGGQFSREQEQQIYMVMGVAVFLVFMLTAALFESLLLPLCVLLTVPMALIGVFLIFFYFEVTFTREAYFGVIIMAGIVVNNAIILVDHINRLRWEEGMALKPAVVRGTVERVRPILMTTTTTIAGLLPLVLFSESVNASIWNALAFVLIGGLASSAIFVLSATPAIYYLIEVGRGLRAKARAASAA